MKKLITLIIQLFFFLFSFAQPCTFSANNFLITRMPGNIYCNSMQVKYTVPGNGSYSFEYRNNIAPYNAGAMLLNTASGLYETNTEMPTGNYTIIGYYGDCKDSARFTFFANELPVVTLSGSQCAGGTLTASTNGSGMESLLWKQNGNQVQTSSTGWNANGVTVAGFNKRGSSLDFPISVKVDVEGNVYVGEGGGQVSKWAPGATKGTEVTVGKYGVEPAGLFLDVAGNLFVADRSHHQVLKWTPGASDGIVVARGNLQGDALNQLLDPNDVYVDASGNIFIADSYNNRVVKWAPGASTGSLVVGGLGYPKCITFDGAGNLYISEESKNMVTKWTASGTFIKVVAGGNGAGSEANQLNTPQGIAVDAAGNIFVVDKFNMRLQKWASGATEGVTITGTGEMGTGANQFIYPQGICLDANGNLYVADSYNHRVQRFNLSTIQFIKPTSPGSYTVAIKDVNGCKAESQVFVVNDQPNIVFAGKITACTGIADTVKVSGGNTYTWQPGNLTGATQALSSATPGVIVYRVTAANSNSTCFDTDSFAIKTFANESPVVTLSGSQCAGGILTASSSGMGLESILWKLNDNLVKTSPSGWNPNGVTVAGGNGRGTAPNQMYKAHQPFVDASGNLYVAEEYGARVSKWAPGATEGTLVTVGRRVAAAGLFVDAVGNVFVADKSSHQVLKWTPGASDGIVVAGGRGQGNALNQLYNPDDVYVDASGNIFIADSYNFRVVKWAPGASRGSLVVGGLNSLPSYITFDGTGNLYISEGVQNRVTKWTAGGLFIKVVAGGNGAGKAANQLDYPTGIAVDAFGNVFVADEKNQRLQKWAPGATEGVTISGIVTVCSGEKQFIDAVGICLDANGNIYVAEGNNDRVQRFYLSTNQFIKPTSPGSYTVAIKDINGCKTASQAFVINDQPNIVIAGKTTACTGIADTVKASGGNTYTWQPGNLTGAIQALTSATPGVIVYKVTAANSNSTCFDTDSFAIKTFASPTVSISGTTCINNTLSASVKRTSANNLIWSFNNNPVHITNASWQENGITVAGGNGAGDMPNQLSDVMGVFVDDNNNIYVADAGNNRIQKFLPGTTQGITVAGGNGPGSSSDRLWQAAGIFVDRFNNVFVADENNNRIQKWAPNATFGVTVAGGNGAGSASNQLYNPTGIIVDELGNLYISDRYNYRIQKWGPGASEGITVAGRNGYGHSANQLAGNMGISLDGFGNLYVMNSGNSQVKKFLPGVENGIIVAGGNGYGTNPNQIQGRGMFVDGLGNIYAADYWFSRVQLWKAGASSGITIAGITGFGGSGSNQLSGPEGVFLDTNGDLYVGEAYVTEGFKRRLQKFKKQIDTTYIPTAPGQYKVQVNDFNGCSAESNIIIVKNIIPATPVVISGQASNLCGSGTFKYSIAPDKYSDFYTWTVPAGCSIQTGQGTTSINVTVSAAFNKGTISVYATNNCSGKRGGERFLYVSKLPLRPASINGLSAVSANQTNIQFSISTVEPNVTYFWCIPSGVTIVSGQGTGTVTVNWGTKTKDISVYAYNSCGTAYATYKTVAITVAARGSNPAITDAVNTTEDISMQVYPNPAKGLVYLGFSRLLKEQGSVQITDAAGRTVLLQSNQSLYSNLPVNISNLKNGIYLVTVIANNKRMTAKLIVEQ